MKRLTKRGVRKTPNTLEREAAETAKAMFPFAMEVKVMEDWTVEGRRERKMSPIANSRFKKRLKNGERVSEIMGNITKVDKIMTR
jgi:hypothetical protein